MVRHVYTVCADNVTCASKEPALYEAYIPKMGTRKTMKRGKLRMESILPWRHFILVMRQAS